MRAGFRTLNFFDWLRTKYKLNISVFLHKLILFEPKFVNAFLRSRVMDLSYKRRPRVSSEKLFSKSLFLQQLSRAFGDYLSS